MSSESDFELDCKTLAELMGWISYKGSGEDGAPDRIYLKNGRGWVAEKKIPNSHHQTQNQKTEQKRIESCGVDYYLIEDLTQFKKAILEQEQKL